jgi:hypothetical protein
VDSIEGLEKPLLCLDPRAKGPKKRQIAGSSMKGVQMKRIARFSILRSKIGMVVDGIDGLENRHRTAILEMKVQENVGWRGPQ